MPVQQITHNAIFVSSVYTRPYIVKNSGTKTVYLGQDSSLTVETRAFSLPPGSTLNWSGDTELWAITATGEVSEIEILYTGENSFTPGPSTINVGNAVAIEHDAVELLNSNVNYPAKKTTVVYESSDLSKYQSLVIRIGSPTGVEESRSRLQIEFLTLNGVLVEIAAPYFFMSGILDFIIPISAPRVKISVVSDSPALRSLRTIILGNTKFLKRHYSHVPGLTSVYNGFVSYDEYANANTARIVELYAIIPAGGIGTAYLNSIAGEAFISVMTGAGGSRGMWINLQAALGRRSRMGIFRTPTMQSNTPPIREKIITPEAPLVLSYNYDGGTADYDGYTTIVWK